MRKMTGLILLLSILAIITGGCVPIQAAQERDFKNNGDLTMRKIVITAGVW